MQQANDPGADGRSLVDPEMLSVLSEECGSEMVAIVIDCFAEEGRGHLEALELACGAADAAGAAAALHAMRGGALSLGLDRLVARIRALETAANQGALPGVSARIGLARLFRISLDAVQAEVAQAA